MSTLTLQLPPSLTPTIQLYARIGGAAVGSPVTMVEGSASIYTCTVPSGDYDVILSGVSTPNALPFPMRDGIAYDSLTWELIDMITLIDSVLVNNLSQPTAAKNKLPDPIIIGDDYLASVGRNFEWQVNAITGYTAANLTCSFGGSMGANAWLVTGTVTTITGGLSLKFDLPKTSTASLHPGYYAWSVEVKTAIGGIEVTRVVGSQPVQLVAKQT